ncbi:response regulator receiver protein [Halomicrococcus sp. NG-SE-24]|uniref:response regulator receiver protein n=1 Tax=Halomicrococcus sp. NG-SE-24 TaxID=3436928 RepID=UPI003D994455
MTKADTGSDQTERLREIFQDITDESTVTEEQQESHGTLQQSSAVDETLREIIQEMQAEHEFQTSLSTADLIDLVQLYFDDYSDTAIARELGDASRDKSVARARIHLQLFRDTDFDAPFDLDRLRALLDEEASTTEIADRLAVSTSTVRKYRRVTQAERAAEAVNHHYQQRFEDALAEPDQEESLRESLADGLDDALDDSLAEN